MTTFRFPDHIEHQLDQLCAATRRPKSFYIREAMERYMEDIVDALVIRDRAQKRGKKYYTSAQVLEKLKLKP